MGHFNLIVQYPKPQNPVHGVLSMNKSGDAQFFTGNGESDSRIVGTLERARVEHAASNGILISGVERVGGNKYRFQEWWLVYALTKNSAA
jgi:hypothetical protein